jgi:hypothetical protein
MRISLSHAHTHASSDVRRDASPAPSKRWLFYPVCRESGHVNCRFTDDGPCLTHHKSRNGRKTLSKIQLRKLKRQHLAAIAA